MTLGIDYAWTHPDPKAIYDAGYRVVMRYLSNDATKDLSVAEAKALHAAGLGIGLVWETTASRAGAGEAAGKADAAAANAKADALGFPKSCPIFYAVDYDATPDAVTPYFIGAGNVTGRPLGVYGSYRVVEAMMAAYCNYGWQTMAWSWDTATQRYLVSPHAHLYQRIKHTLGPIAGIADSAWDEDAVLRPFPLWNPSTQEDDMPLTADDARTIWRTDIIPSPDADPANPAWQPDSYLKQTYLLVREAKTAAADAKTAVAELATQVEALAAKLDALSQSGPVGVSPTVGEIADEIAARLRA